MVVFKNLDGQIIGGIEDNGSIRGSSAQYMGSIRNGTIYDYNDHKIATLDTKTGIIYDNRKQYAGCIKKQDSYWEILNRQKEFVCKVEFYQEKVASMSAKTRH